MNQMASVLYSRAIQILVESDLKLTKLSAIISPYLIKFMKHNKSNTVFFHEVVIFFLQFIDQQPLM